MQGHCDWCAMWVTRLLHYAGHMLCKHCLDMHCE